MEACRMRRCRKIRKDIDKYLDGELEPEKIPFFEGHLKTCALCRETLARHREERQQRVLGLLPDEIPVTTHDILTSLQGNAPAKPAAAPVIFPEFKESPLIRAKKWVFRPVPAAAFALCIIALGLSLFLPFNTHRKDSGAGVIIDQIESSQNVMIYQPEKTGTTIIWIMPASAKEIS
jgi:anti-sigma factor RsiW